MEARPGINPSNPFRFLIKSFKLSLLGVIVLVLIFALNQIKFSHYFPIKTVRVFGADHVDHEAFKDMLSPLAKTGFFNVKVEMIRDRLLELPWVSHIVVRRIWPDEINIMVKEKEAVAAWNGQSLISSTGELFFPDVASFPRDLPQFIGPPGQQLAMLETLKEIDQRLQPLQVKVSCLELSPYQSYRVTLDNGIVLRLGDKDILTRIDHFVKVYAKIIGKSAYDVESVDLRYPNGIAVRWKATDKGKVASGRRS